MEPTIEILGPGEWQEYRDVRLIALKTDPASFGASYEQEKDKTEEEIRGSLSNISHRAYVAKIGDKVAALAVYDLVIPANVAHVARVSSVFTDPSFRKQGIGEKLMAKMIKDLHDNPITARIVLSVGSDKEAAIKMYKKLGFQEFGIGHKEMKYEGNYIDQIQMELIFEDKLI